MLNKEAARPLVLYSRSPDAAAGQYDCDCACAVELPSVLAAQSAPGSYDCDCACALDVPRGPALHMAPLWVKQKQLRRFPLAGGWQAFFNPSGPVGVAALNEGAHRVLDAFDSPIPPERALSRLPEMSPAAVKNVIQDLAQVGLLRPLESPPPLLGRASVLSAWLHVTEACNLSCPYCYVHKSPKTMSTQTGTRAVDRLVEMASRHGYTSLKLKYAGGEPTLKFPLVEALHTRANRQAAEAGLVLEGIILTNGVGVSDAMLDFMVGAGMRLMVSLDGGPATHNRVRTGCNGRGSYDAVVGTVERALKRGLHPNISITLTALNLDGAAEAVAFALERDLPFNLNFYRQCAAEDSAELPSPLMPERARLEDTMLEILDLVAAFPTYPRPLTGILDRTRLDVPHRYPCSAGRDYLAMNTEGTISACQMLLGEPWADLTTADPLVEVRRRGQDLFRAVDERPDCDTCPWSTACSGGCPLMRGFTLCHDYCRVYQALFPKLVRLEANRLIAAQASLLQ